MINLILGPPGTGKTEEIITELKKASLKVALNEIALVSFTKAAISEAIRRVKKIFPDAKQKIDFKFFKTLHALCFMLLGVKRNQMITDDLQEKFQNEMGQAGLDVSLNFSQNSIYNKRNIPITLYHIAQNRQEDIKTVYNSGYFDVSFDTVEYVKEAYETFKEYYKILDFNDLLLGILKTDIEPLNCKYVFLDEAQDFTKLQWLVFRKLFSPSSIIYIAGDDDQSIYEWSGVDVDNFLNVEHDTKKILNQSHRLPANILNFSKKIIDKVEKRFDKEYKPRAAGGGLYTIISIEEIKEKLLDKSESWLFLVRNIYLHINFKDQLFYAGVPFISFGKSSLLTDDVKAVYLWEKFKKGTYKLDDKDKTFLNGFLGDYEKDKSWYEKFIYMDLDTSNYYREVLKNGFNLLDRPNIEITTIHRSKGREADNVVILPDMSYTTAKMAEVNADSEHRVYYVGCTRAKKNLYIMEPTTNNYYEGVIE